MVVKKVEVLGIIYVYYDKIGFFREVYDDEIGVIDGIKKYMDYLLVYDLEFFRVDELIELVFDLNDLYLIILMN